MKLVIKREEVMLRIKKEKRLMQVLTQLLGWKGSFLCSFRCYASAIDSNLNCKLVILQVAVGSHWMAFDRCQF